LAVEKTNPDGHVVAAVEGGEVRDGCRVEACFEGSDHQADGDEAAGAADEGVG